MSTESRAIKHVADLHKRAALWMVRLTRFWLTAHPGATRFNGLEFYVERGGERIFADSDTTNIPNDASRLDLWHDSFFTPAENDEICAHVYEMIVAGFKGATAASDFRLCDLAECTSRKEYRRRVCVPFGKKWICEQCEKAFAALEQSKQKERSLVTPKLRIDIFRRDHFACQICRRNSKEDGVKLTVDHIIPITSGGKTVEGNLQTLCFECNSGKSDSLL